MAAGDASVLDLILASAASRALYARAAPRWRPARDEVCRNLGARRRLARRWTAFERFVGPRARANLNGPLRKDRVRRIFFVLPREYLFSVLYHHDGQDDGGSMAGYGRLFTLEEVFSLRADAFYESSDWSLQITDAAKRRGNRRGSPSTPRLRRRSPKDEFARGRVDAAAAT